MIDLAALIATAKATVQEKEALKAAQTKVRSLSQGAPHSPALKKATAEAAALLQRMSWTTVAVAFRETSWECSCGHSGRAPEGLFLVQEHTRLAATRYVRLDHPAQAEGLRRTRVVEARSVTVCRSCAYIEGYREPYIRDMVAPPEVPHVVTFANPEPVTAVAWIQENPHDETSDD